MPLTSRGINAPREAVLVSSDVESGEKMLKGAAGRFWRPLVDLRLA